MNFFVNAIFLWRHNDQKSSKVDVDFDIKLFYVSGNITGFTKIGE